MTLGPGFSFDPPEPKDPPPGIGERTADDMSDEDLDAAEVDRQVDAVRDKGWTAFNRRERRLQ